MAALESIWVEEIGKVCSDGVKTLFDGFKILDITLPPERRRSRACFLRRLIFAWSCCYTAVTPVMIYTLFVNLAGR